MPHILSNEEKERLFSAREVKSDDVNAVLKDCMDKIKSSKLGMSILQGANYKEVTDKASYNAAVARHEYAVEKVYVGIAGNVKGGHCGLIAAQDDDKTYENARGEVYLNEDFVRYCINSLGKEKGTIYLTNLICHEFTHGNQRKFMNNVVENSKSRPPMPSKFQSQQKISYEEFKAQEEGWARMILTEADAMASGLTVMKELSE